jgi:uncharacterized membrane protein YgdD (TMEM256/DUF423 family)
LRAFPHSLLVEALGNPAIGLDAAIIQLFAIVLAQCFRVDAENTGDILFPARQAEEPEAARLASLAAADSLRPPRRLRTSRPRGIKSPERSDPAMAIDWFSRMMLFCAGLLGAGGVAAAAASTHQGGPLLQPLALIALTHAPPLLAFGLSPARSAGLRVGAIVVAAGAVVFAADLTVRHLWGPHLFPYSAPGGGTAMIAGWAIVAIAGLATRTVCPIP